MPGEEEVESIEIDHYAITVKKSVKEFSSQSLLEATFGKNARGGVSLTNNFMIVGENTGWNMR